VTDQGIVLVSVVDVRLSVVVGSGQLVIGNEPSGPHSINFAVLWYSASWQAKKVVMGFMERSKWIMVSVVWQYLPCSARSDMIAAEKVVGIVGVGVCGVRDGTKGMIVVAMLWGGMVEMAEVPIARLAARRE